MRFFISRMPTPRERELSYQISDALYARGHFARFLHLGNELRDHIDDPDAVDQALRGCDAAICLLSRAYLQDAWMHKEVMAFRQKERRQGSRFVIPARADDIDVESDGVRQLVGRRDIVDFSEASAFGQAFQKLLEVIAREVVRLFLFISHSSVDRDIATALVNLISKAFSLRAGDVLCTTVDGYGLPLGALIDERLRRNAIEADTFLALITPSSIHSPYAMLEVGARWGAGLKVFPLTAGVARIPPLPGPLTTSQARSCDEGPQVVQFLVDLSKHTGRELNPLNSLDSEIRAVVAAARDAAQRHKEGVGTGSR